MWPPWTTCLMPFTRPRPVAWEWGLRSVRRSSNATADGCGLRPTPPAGPHSGSGCRPEASPHDDFASSPNGLPAAGARLSRHPLAGRCAPEPNELVIELLIGFVQGMTIECLLAKDGNFHMQSSDKILRAPLQPGLTPTEARCQRYPSRGFRNKLITLVTLSWVRHQARGEKWVTKSVNAEAPRCDNSGKVAGASKIARDITATKRVEADLRETRPEPRRLTPRERRSPVMTGSEK